MTAGRRLLVVTAALVLAAAAPSAAAQRTSRGAIHGPGGPGSVLWSRRFDCPAGGADHSQGIALPPDGSRVFVAAQTCSARGSSRWTTFAYRAGTGKLLWESQFHHRGRTNFPQDIAIGPDGTVVFVAGAIQGSANWDWAVVAYRASSGARLWSASYDGPAGGLDLATDLAVSPDGTRLFVTGSSTGVHSGTDWQTFAYDAGTGAVLWDRRHTGSTNAGPEYGHDAPSDIAVTPDGATVIVTGTTDHPVTHYDYTTLAYRADTGARLWIATYDGPGSHSDQPTDLVLAAHGRRVFVTGASKTAGTYDVATVAYLTGTGGLMWVARHDGPSHGDDFGEAIAASPDDRTVFVGAVANAGDPDAAVLAYRAATGAPVWVSGPGADVLAVSADGSTVFGAIGSARGALARGTLSAIDAGSGAPRWSREVGDGSGDIIPAIATGPDPSVLFAARDIDAYGPNPDLGAAAFRAT